MILPRSGYFAGLLEREDLKAQILKLARLSLSRALLFVGEAGSGKRSTSLAAAEAILCLNLDEEGPCGVCDSCRYLSASSHPDFMSLEPETEGDLIPVKEVRTFATRASQILPQVGEMSVFMIDASALNEQGQNALLKTIEEPPTRAVFLLHVEQADRLLPTVRSRVLELPMPGLSDEALMKIAELKQAGQDGQDGKDGQDGSKQSGKAVKVDKTVKCGTTGTIDKTDRTGLPLTPKDPSQQMLDEGLRLRLAAGNPGRYLHLGKTNEWLEDELLSRELLVRIAQGDLGEALGTHLMKLKDYIKTDAGTFFYFMKSYGHELLRLRLDLPAENLVHPAAREALKILDRDTTQGVRWIADYHALCDIYERKLKRSLNAELQLSAFVLEIDEVMHHV